MLPKPSTALVLPLAWDFAPEAALARRAALAAGFAAPRAPHLPLFFVRQRAALARFAARVRACWSVRIAQGKRHANSH